MTHEVADLMRLAERLPAGERFDLAEQILGSLGLPPPCPAVGGPEAHDPLLDQLWAEESIRRLDGWKRGEIGSVPAQDMFPEP